jgi:hypothetical protein
MSANQWPPVKYSIAVENAANVAQPKHIALGPPKKSGWGFFEGCVIVVVV